MTMILIAACVLHLHSSDQIFTGRVTADEGNAWRVETSGLELGLHDMGFEEYLIEKDDCVTRVYNPRRNLE